MTLLKRVLAGILIFLLLLVVIIGFLIGTTPGLHLVLNALRAGFRVYRFNRSKVAGEI